ncbi:MurR/RpiR family transcriptional regulator [Marinococcus sp. PL1-022]|uniref:MurR/RpiR family transcriptional regulator n=1 Tax=Marinococcus sp. PL1-022 TaxID=3095363 RepID=UPI0029C511E5|nr:MurR/RpiR family transcriptional regulator [Marinococcus sp. PL1-022]MDX6152787.1 MurR/RpiR family transcriptional regulator [Marinococcus sp. PL1-022]
MNDLLQLDDHQLTGKQKQIADILWKRGLGVAYMNEAEVAQEAGVSIASVSRFWALAGYKNFKAFKAAVREKIETTPENKLKNSVSQTKDDPLFDQLVDQHFKSLALTSQQFEERTFKAAILTIMKATTVFIHAPASSEGLGTLLEFRLKRFGFSVERIAKSGAEIYESLIHMNEASTVIVFQFVEPLPETKVLLDYAQKCGAGTVLITDRLVSEMNASVDHLLYVYRGEQWEFHTMVTPTVMLEALVIGIGSEMEEQSLEQLKKISRIRNHYKHIVPK